MDVEELVEMAKAQDSREAKHPGETRVLTVIENEVTEEVEIFFNRDPDAAVSADTVGACVEKVEALRDE